MKVHIAIIAGLLSLTACSEQQNSATYNCGKQNAVLNIINGSQAKLVFNKKTHLLSHEESASGNKYINEKVLFWGKGKEAMLIIEGNKLQCNIV
ncbi:MliC family protein [Pseudoalteromonas carrageenovora]|uniref:MliC family protein n=1 Tax=Pseudoalteromonas carrageenovora TaxID=227 RepID=UPI002118426B|nr:MliC family protein [Pseudoalteromonas carrageenovora]MCQ8891306.1 MliC family protein [Pseudoalteromonas carrageenovora]MDO6464870.1 MliC family protein [Pseudoalteromonas carrageenovora]